jgi:predicted DCC family thiol-disulfide oxidoreductase YuxK
VLAGFYYLGVPQLYGKVDHIHHLLWIGAILAVSPSADVLSVQALWRAWRRTDTQSVELLQESLRYSLPLRFIWLVLGLGYASAGLAKYRFDGLEWLSPATLAYWLHLLWYQSGAYRPPLISRPDELTPVLVGGAAFTLAFETTFLLWIFIDRARPILALAAIVFHNATNFLMRIPFWTLQIIALCLVDWERLSEAVFRRRHTVRFIYDGNCGICKKTVVGLRALAPPGAIEFVNGLDRRALNRGGLSWLSEAAVVADVQVVTDGSALAGFDGYRRIARRVPALWPALPLLYLPPVATLGRRIYRHVADHRSCALEETTPVAPASRVTAAPIAAVGVALLAVLVTLCVYSLRSGETSTRAMNGWPFATYPTFAGIGDGTTTQLAMQTRTPVGALEPLEFGSRLRFASAHRVVGLLGAIIEEPDRAKQERAMRALVRFARPTGRAGQAVDNVVIVRQRVSVSPGTAGKVLASRTLLAMPMPTSGR